MALFDENVSVTPARRAPINRRTRVGLWALVVALLVQMRRSDVWSYPLAVGWALIGVIAANWPARNWPVIGIAVIGIVVLAAVALRGRRSGRR